MSLWRPSRELVRPSRRSFLSLAGLALGGFGAGLTGLEPARDELAWLQSPHAVPSDRWILELHEHRTLDLFRALAVRIDG